MADPTQPSTPTTSDQEPGHYGAGYGEQVPEDAPPRLGPATDGDPPPSADDEGPGSAGASDGEPVAFTPADVHARPPERAPTDAAPESEKAALVFERS